MRLGNEPKILNPLPMSKYTAFRCPEDLLELAKMKAKKDRRSLSNYIITLIEKDVKDLLPREDGDHDPSAAERKK
jgi:predicted HicB family RNase H-like nuclease